MDKEQTERSYHHMRNAIIKLREFSLPPSPPNYSVCYELVSGENAELLEQVERLTADSKQMSDSEVEELFYSYVLRLNEQYLHSVQDDVLNLLEGVNSSLKSIHSNTGDFDEKLEAQSELLNSNATLQTLSKIVTILKQGTSQLRDSNAEVRKQIDTQIAETQKLKNDLKQAKKEASIDFLTGLNNRQTFDSALTDMIVEAEKNQEKLCLLLIDIDHFKAFNDKFGHLVGDKVIAYVANTMKKAIRGTDVIARFGGEEFSILLPNTNYPGAIVVAEQIRKTIASTRLVNSVTRDALPSIEVSVGVACYREGEEAETYIDRADKALYLSKGRGRNRVSGEEDLEG